MKNQAQFDPCEFGAKADGTTLCTEAIQNAVEACAAAGGGTVLLSGGTFLSGTICLRSHVTLEIDAGATLLGSPDIADYPDYPGSVVWYLHGQVAKSLIFGEDLENVAIIGRGVIDGQGANFPMVRSQEMKNRNRPYLIRLTRCRDVHVEGLRLCNSGMWMQHYLACERLTMRGVRVWNYCNHNNDSLDLDGCRDCSISQCFFESDDDGITLKSTLERPSENITISDCLVRTHCNAIKFGTESSGGFKDITVTNCVIASPDPSIKRHFGHDRGTGGITLELVDGGVMERVAISNITIRGVEVPLFLFLGDRARPFKPGMGPIGIGRFRDVTISNIVATNAGRTGSSIIGHSEVPIENVTLSNIHIQSDGGGGRELSDREIAELPKNYPEGVMFGELPGYGLYCRHVSGLKLSNISLRTDVPDLRSAVAMDDVTNLSICGLDAGSPPGAAPMIRLVQTSRAMISGCQPQGGSFVYLSGDRCANVALAGNDLSSLETPVEIAPGTPANALREI